MRIVLAAMLMASTVLAQQAPTKTVPQQGPPPKNLTVRPDGHVSANQDPANPENFEIRVVKRGDTLSAIAGEVLKDPRLWPQLWEQNEHIINPHWIYPNDKILIRPVTVLSEAKPPEPEPPPPAPELPAPAPLPEVAVPPAPRPAPAPAPPPVQAPPERILEFTERKPTSEVKIDDLYCSGFVTTAPVSKNLKAIAKYDVTGGVLTAETDYVYLSQGSEDGIIAGKVYKVIRATRTLTNPKGRTRMERDLGMHYLEIAYLRVTLTQADFSLARVIHSCGDGVEIGDIMVPFEPIVLPPLERPRPFSPLMTTTSGVKGEIVGSQIVLLSNGSRFAGPNIEPGVMGNRLSVVNRGVAVEGSIVYLDIGQNKSVSPGDIFIVYREMVFDSRLYSFPKEADRLKAQRTAVGELIVVKVNERASTALVSYSTDGLSLGDSVERR
ncbi:MAG TPA: LysM peptidoglycan-binding domain-containing protein [Terriglobia bacterium]|nr:LysM peptidoglycan-binding domain-containing protein [Terriglobia bacterium]